MLSLDNAYSEAELRAFDSELDVLVINDGSEDATAQSASAAGAIVVSLPFNLGIGGADLIRLRRGLPPEVETDVDEKRRVLRVRRGEVELVADFEHLTAEVRG